MHILPLLHFPQGHFSPFHFKWNKSHISSALKMFHSENSFLKAGHFSSKNESTMFGSTDFVSTDAFTYNSNWFKALAALILSRFFKIVDKVLLAIPVFFSDLSSTSYKIFLLENENNFFLNAWKKKFKYNGRLVSNDKNCCLWFIIGTILKAAAQDKVLSAYENIHLPGCD